MREVRVSSIVIGDNYLIRSYYNVSKRFVYRVTSSINLSKIWIYKIIVLVMIDVRVRDAIPYPIKGLSVWIDRKC